GSFRRPDTWSARFLPERGPGLPESCCSSSEGFRLGPCRDRRSTIGARDRRPTEDPGRAVRAATIREMPIPSWHRAETARAGAQIQREPVRTALSWLVAVSFVILAVTTVLAFVRPPVPAEVSTLTWIRGTFGGSRDGLMRFLYVAGSGGVTRPASCALQLWLTLVCVAL